ncbi:prolipoprotein diacylglyceryl transferase [Christensenellaceae bacterium OttesenSCG-928-L17]|nr:prolipoprotein diacylglyceryl transferase [Christensenellaceae bacterium OttesenSCG-928-L17]
MLPQLHIFSGGTQLTVSTYGLCACIAALLGAALAWPRLLRSGLRTRQAVTLLLGMTVAFLVGARLWNLAVNPANYSGTLRWYSLRFAGLSLYGGIASAMAVLLALLWRWRIPVWAALDSMVTPACAAFVVARLGCFAAGCCAGRVTTAPWGLVFPARVAAQEALGRMMPLLGGAKLLHPTQLYELFGATLCLLITLAVFRRRGILPGSRFLLFGSLFCLMRLAVLPFRALVYAEPVASVLYPLLYGGLALAGLVILLFRVCTQRNSTGGIH